MLKESFFFLPSNKYGHLTRSFFCGTNVEDDLEDVAFSIFAGFCQDHSSGGLTHIILIILILQFQETISGKHKYALGAIEYSSPAPDKSKCKAEKK